jgi:hypothetical protein
MRRLFPMIKEDAGDSVYFLDGSHLPGNYLTIHYDDENKTFP